MMRFTDDDLRFIEEETKDSSILNRQLAILTKAIIMLIDRLDERRDK